MYVLLNRNKMSFAHKHHDIFCLANLAWMENRDMEFHIFPLDNAFEFNKFTDEELEQLFQNTVGEPFPETNRNALKQALFDAAMRIHASKVNIHEAETQASKVPDGSEQCYEYKPGKMAPVKCAQMIRVMTTDFRPEEVESALKGILPALKRDTSRSTTSKPNRGAVTPKGGCDAPPKHGTAKATIWKVADEMWEEDGKPADKESVFTLRKSIMNELEKQGIKRTSASTELGKWHKERAPF